MEFGRKLGFLNFGNTFFTNARLNLIETFTPSWYTNGKLLLKKLNLYLSRKIIN